MAKKYDDMTTREKSRFAQNERRKIERRMARVLKEEYGVKTTAKEAAKVYKEGKYDSAELKMLSKERESLFAKKVKGTQRRKGYDVNIQQVGENISAYTQIKYGMETLSNKGDVTQLRKNKLFERSINQSTKKDGFSLLEKTETKAFYAATQDIWKTQATSGKYNIAIMQEFGVNDLETVYKLLTKRKFKKEDFGFSDNEEFKAWLKEINEKVNLFKRRNIVLEELKGMKIGGTTEDETYNKEDEKEYESSPEYINRIINRIATALNG